MAIHDPHARLQIPPLRFAHPPARGVIHPLPRSVLLSAGDIPATGTRCPESETAREIAPLTPGPQNIENGVGDLLALDPDQSSGRLRLREERLKDGPLRIGEVARRLVTSSHDPSIPASSSCFSTRSKGGRHQARRSWQLVPCRPLGTRISHRWGICWGVIQINFFDSK